MKKHTYRALIQKNPHYRPLPGMWFKGLVSGNHYLILDKVQRLEDNFLALDHENCLLVWQAKNKKQMQLAIGSHIDFHPDHEEMNCVLLEYQVRQKLQTLLDSGKIRSAGLQYRDAVKDYLYWTIQNRYIPQSFTIDNHNNSRTETLVAILINLEDLCRTKS